MPGVRVPLAVGRAVVKSCVRPANCYAGYCSGCFLLVVSGVTCDTMEPSFLLVVQMWLQSWHW